MRRKFGKLWVIPMDQTCYIAFLHFTQSPFLVTTSGSIRFPLPNDLHMQVHHFTNQIVYNFNPISDKERVSALIFLQEVN